MIGYHYSPSDNRVSIWRHGLLVPKLHPKLTRPMTCSEGHRNPHISLADNPHDAWILSGGFIFNRILEGDRLTYFHAPEYWDLWQVDLTGRPYRRYGLELQSRKDISKGALLYVGTRGLRE